LGPEDTFRVRFETTAGPFVVQVNPEWAPRGATQFRELVEAGFFDENRFFRVMPGFIVQFGINGDPEENEKWRQPIPDEPVGHSNTKGTITFAKPGMPDSRSTQVFINLKDNTATLDNQGFSPFGEVLEGMENVEKINAEYGEQPDQSKIESTGNAYLMRNFPRLDYIKSARIVQ
jgi:cyclophilin family peptidyl-prolyl cis-trans isomerase